MIDRQSFSFSFGQHVFIYVFLPSQPGSNFPSSCSLSFQDDSKLYIFLELVTKGSLLSLYQKYDLRETQASAYTRQILNGLKYLHEQNVVHRWEKWFFRLIICFYIYIYSFICVSNYLCFLVFSAFLFNVLLWTCFDYFHFLALNHQDSEWICMSYTILACTTFFDASKWQQPLKVSKT